MPRPKTRIGLSNRFTTKTLTRKGLSNEPAKPTNKKPKIPTAADIEDEQDGYQDEQAEINERSRKSANDGAHTASPGSERGKAIGPLQGEDYDGLQPQDKKKKEQREAAPRRDMNLGGKTNGIARLARGIESQLRTQHPR